MSQEDTLPRPVVDITIEVDGVKHHGDYFVYDDAIFVRSPLGAKCIPESSGAASLAKLLLSEIVRGIWP
jgi:hypothetical protein